MALVTGVVLVLASTLFASAESGLASHYATYDKDQTGTVVACRGYRLSNSALVAAHRTAPCGSMITVRNKRTGKSIQVRVIDRGPFVRGRIVDLSLGAARALGINGLGHVEVTR